MGVLCLQFENNLVYALDLTGDPVTICNTRSTEVRRLQKARKHYNINVCNISGKTEFTMKREKVFFKNAGTRQKYGHNINDYNSYPVPDEFGTPGTIHCHSRQLRPLD